MKSIRSVNPEKLLLEFFESENISLKANGRVFAVCFSGGPDSTALLLLMHRLSIRYQFPLKAVHVRHNIRSEAESCAEEEFVRRFCRERNIEIHSESLPPGFLSQKLRECKRSPEEAARIERYRIFCKLKQEGFADWFLTAHHADDNRETVVQRIFEGAGLFGLKGIPRRNGFFLRPLLTVSKQTLIELLSENHLTGIFDSTNGDLSISRNRFRSTIAPFLDREVPGWKSGIDRLIEKVNAAAQALLRLPIETVIEKDGEMYGYKLDNIGYITNADAYTTRGDILCKAAGGWQYDQASKTGNPSFSLGFPSGITELANYKGAEVEIEYSVTATRMDKTMSQFGTPVYTVHKTDGEEKLISSGNKKSLVLEEDKVFEINVINDVIPYTDVEFVADGYYRFSVRVTQIVIKNGEEILFVRDF